MTPARLTFSAAVGGANPQNQTLSIRNAQGGTLNWTASSNAAWLSIEPAAGSQSGTVTLAVDTAGLTAGTHLTNITIIGNAANSPQSVAVTLSLADSPTIGLTPSSLSFTVKAGGAGTQKLRITNTGSTGTTLPWTASDNQDWIQISPPSGSVPHPAFTEADVSVSAAGMPEGSYAGTVVVSASGATNTPQSVPVTMTVPQQIVVTYPNGGELLRGGQNVTIAWNVDTANCVATTSVSYSTDGGSTWKVVKTMNGLASSCAWKVPTLKSASSFCLVKVEFKNAQKTVIAQDLSNGYFTIAK